MIHELVWTATGLALAYMVQPTEKGQKLAAQLIELGVAKVPPIAKWTVNQVQNQLAAGSGQKSLPPAVMISESQLEAIVDAPAEHRQDTIESIIAAVKRGRVNELDSI